MDGRAAVVVEAAHMLHQDLYRHLEKAEYLSDVDWTEEQHDLVRELLNELPMVIRHTIAPHRAADSGDCLTCGRAWPCEVVITVHRLVKSPSNHFLQLMEQVDER